jgi:hypothetical protein
MRSGATPEGASTDMPELRFGPDGYLDLSVFADGDPDSVLPTEDLATLHDAIVASGSDVEDTQWDRLLGEALHVESDDPTLDAGADGTESGPFDLGMWAVPPTGPATDPDDGPPGAPDPTTAEEHREGSDDPTAGDQGAETDDPTWPWDTDAGMDTADYGFDLATGADVVDDGANPIDPDPLGSDYDVDL